MGEFFVTFEVGNPAGQQWRRLEGLVDTGATYTWVPADFLRDLGVSPEDRWEFEIAGGGVLERDVAETRVRLGGEARTTIVVFADEGDLSLLGAYTLEGFRLAVDPVNPRLIPVRPRAMTLTI